MQKMKKNEKCYLKHQREGKVRFAINQSFGKFLMLQQVVVVFAVADVRVVVPDTAASSSSSCCC